MFVNSLVINYLLRDGSPEPGDRIKEMCDALLEMDYENIFKAPRAAS
ncbi:hypothetical protein M6D81_04990 [Paenibacillus sp. J5C_2022]|nr:hypothetical protein [Paenibacillus sp. J5C2022]MCU6708063.1 hypothetical protein [Paenibacillus sp. J5C2022]